MITGAAGATGLGGSFGIAGTGGPDAACTPTVTCTPPGGTYCGRIGNGCRGQALECGACSGDNTCDMGGGTSGGLCVGGPDLPGAHLHGRHRPSTATRSATAAGGR